MRRSDEFASHRGGGDRAGAAVAAFPCAGPDDDPGARGKTPPGPCARQPGPRRQGSDRPARAHGRRGRYKRRFDLAVTALLFLALLPLWLMLFAAVAAVIRLQDGGSVLHRQARLGRGGQVFSMLKFRTMAENAERGTGPVWAQPYDARTTAVGRLLRRFHLDELPQVVNVLRGEMSLVGPRPERPEIAARIEREVPGFARRLAVRPGIAGLAQARSLWSHSPRNKLRYDLVYIRAMGPWLDLWLCAACVWRALQGPRRPGEDGRRVRPGTSLRARSRGGAWARRP